MLADGKYELSSQAASQILWSTGTLTSAIPNGFYSIIPDKKLKELFDTIPSLDDLYSLGADGLKAEIILVDIEKDRKLSMLKQLCAALVKGLSTNPTLLIKKIAGLIESREGSTTSGWVDEAATEFAEKYHVRIEELRSQGVEVTQEVEEDVFRSLSSSLAKRPDRKPNYGNIPSKRLSDRGVSYNTNEVQETAKLQDQVTSLA